MLLVRYSDEYLRYHEEDDSEGYIGTQAFNDAVYEYGSKERTILLATTLPRLAIGPCVSAMVYWMFYNASTIANEDRPQPLRAVRINYLYETDFSS